MTVGELRLVAAGADVVRAGVLRGDGRHQSVLGAVGDEGGVTLLHQARRRSQTEQGGHGRQVGAGCHQLGGGVEHEGAATVQVRGDHGGLVGGQITAGVEENQAVGVHGNGGLGQIQRLHIHAHGIQQAVQGLRGLGVAEARQEVGVGDVLTGDVIQRRGELGLAAEGGHRVVLGDVAHVHALGRQHVGHHRAVLGADRGQSGVGHGLGDVRRQVVGVEPIGQGEQDVGPVVQVRAVHHGEAAVRLHDEAVRAQGGGAVLGGKGGILQRIHHLHLDVLPCLLVAGEEQADLIVHRTALAEPVNGHVLVHARDELLGLVGDLGDAPSRGVEPGELGGKSPHQQVGDDECRQENDTRHEGVGADLNRPLHAEECAMIHSRLPPQKISPNASCPPTGRSGRGRRRGKTGAAAERQCSECRTHRRWRNG